MKGIIIIDHADGCGPKYADFIKPKGIREGATYISDNATPEQRKVLKSFLTTHLAAVHVAKILGVKFVPINITHKDRTYHIAMPFGEQQFTLTVGGDGKTPIRMENGLGSAASNVKFANVEVWKYNDYGKNLEFYNTGGEISDFTMQGTL